MYSSLYLLALSREHLPFSPEREFSKAETTLSSSPCPLGAGGLPPVLCWRTEGEPGLQGTCEGQRGSPRHWSAARESGNKAG